MPLIQANCFLGPQPNAFVHPLGHVVVFDLSIPQVQPVPVGLEYIFIPGYNRAARRCGIDPGGHRVRVVVSDSRIVRTESASSRAVTVKPGDIAAELNEALAIEARRLPD